MNNEMFVNKVSEALNKVLDQDTPPKPIDKLNLIDDDDNRSFLGHLMTKAEIDIFGVNPLSLGQIMITGVDKPSDKYLSVPFIGKWLNKLAKPIKHKWAKDEFSKAQFAVLFLINEAYVNAVFQYRLAEQRPVKTNFNFWLYTQLTKINIHELTHTETELLRRIYFHTIYSEKYKD